MRVNLAGTEYEIRIQERKVTTVDIMRKGKVLSRGIAFKSPKDIQEGKINPVDGVAVAAERASRYLASNRLDQIILRNEIVGAFQAQRARVKQKLRNQMLQLVRKAKVMDRSYIPLGLPYDIPARSGRMRAFVAGMLGLPIKPR